MPAKSFISRLEWEKLSPAEQAELYWMRELEQARNNPQALSTPPARPAATPSAAHYGCAIDCDPGVCDA